MNPSADSKLNAPGTLASTALTNRSTFTTPTTTMKATAERYTRVLVGLILYTIFVVNAVHQQAFLQKLMKIDDLPPYWTSSSNDSRTKSTVDGTAVELNWLLHDEIDVNTQSSGTWKSFFRSKTSSRIGWLVAYNQLSDTTGTTSHTATTGLNTLYDTMTAGWDLMTEVSSRYDISHLYLDRPVLLSNTADKNEKREHNNNKQNNDGSRNSTSTTAPTWGSLLKFVPWSNGTYDDEIATKPIVVQKCRVAPPGSLHIAVKNPFKKQRVYGIRRYITDLMRKMKQDPTPGKNINHILEEYISTFLQQLRYDVDVAKAMLTEYPSLKYDFQVMLDGRTGKLYHLDFDRVYQYQLPLEERQSKLVEENLDYLITFLEKVMSKELQTLKR